MSYLVSIGGLGLGVANKCWCWFMVEALSWCVIWLTTVVCCGCCCCWPSLWAFRRQQLTI